jgi:hypothetical protein
MPDQLAMRRDRLSDEATAVHIEYDLIGGTSLRRYPPCGNATCIDVHMANIFRFRRLADQSLEMGLVCVAPFPRAPGSELSFGRTWLLYSGA